MCGRAATAQSIVEIRKQMHATAVPERELAPNWNTAPTQEMYIVVDRADKETEQFERAVEIAKWGLVPSWAKDAKGGGKLNNARCETVADKPSFKTAYAKRRCLIPVTGYYEWYETNQLNAKGKPEKQPFYMHDPAGQALVFAGLYEWWKPRDDPDAEWLLTCTILTKDADERVSRIHDRMPVMVGADQWAWWLDNTGPVDVNEIQSVPLDAYPVSMAVNNSRSEGPQLIEPIDYDFD